MKSENDLHMNFQFFLEKNETFFGENDFISAILLVKQNYKSLGK